MITNKERIQWIDVAKTIGMFFIVLGHYFPSYLSEWIYSFNVPLFFFLSGFLCKKEESWRIFWRKNIESLIIPYFIYCFLLNLGFLFENIDNIQNLLKWLFACLLGFHSIDSLPGCLNMWFVYCLFFVKFLFQSLPDNRKIGLSICCLCLISLQIYRYYNWSLAWSFTNIPLAYPFFFLGKYCFRYKLVNKVQALRLSSSLLSVICILFFTGLLSSYNGIAFNYTGGGR